MNMKFSLVDCLFIISDMECLSKQLSNTFGLNDDYNSNDNYDHINEIDDEGGGGGHAQGCASIRAG